MTNSSEVEPLVILKHFGPGNPEVPTGSLKGDDSYDK